MARNKQKHKKKLKNHSDVKQIGPGVFAQNFGRWNAIQSQRTPEEQATLMATIKECRLDFPKRIADKVAAIESLIAKYNSFELLACLMVEKLFINPETYHEPTHDHGDILVEYATLLCLKRPFVSQGEPFIGKAYEEVVDKLNSVVWDTIWYYGTEGMGEDLPISCIDGLHRDTITAELMIRNPGYPHHLNAVLTSLFQPFDVWFLNAVGFTISDLMAVEKAVHHLMNKNFLEGRKMAKEAQGVFQGDFENYKKTGALNSEQLKPYFEMLQKLPADRVKGAITDIFYIGFCAKLGAKLSFTIQEVSEIANITPAKIDAVFQIFSLKFNSIPQEFLWPKPNHALKQSPFIQDGNRFMCPNVKLFSWAMRPMLERLLNPDIKAHSNASGETWAKYSDKRASFLENEAVRLLGMALRRAETFQNLKYDNMVDGQLKTFELDGLVIFDKTLILVEAKAGNFPLKARAGHRDAIRDNLKKLVAEAHEQVVNAKNFIESSDNAIFRPEEGKYLNLKKATFNRVLMLVVTLEPLDVFCANLHQTADLGLFPSGELPWVIPLFDLRIIAETIEFPSQLIHYLQRRLRINHIKKLEANDDLDWFGCYLDGELDFEVYKDSGPDMIRLGSFTSNFDDYYFFEQGIRKTPALMPRQNMPGLFRVVVLSIDKSCLANHSEAACVLLDFDKNARQRFSETLESHIRQINETGRINNFTANIPDRKIGATCFVCSPDRVQEASFELSAFVDLMKFKAKADRWLGILFICGASQQVGSWIYSAFPWKEDPQLAVALEELNNPRSSRWRQV